MTATIHALPVPQPQPAPSPASYAIAIAILDAGCGPEQIPWLVGGFKHADEVSREVTAAMACLTRAGCAAIRAASGPS